MNAIQGCLFSVQPFSLHDGPGIRTTVFLKGCAMRCWWCHNVESWDKGGTLLFYPEQCVGCGACVRVCPHSKNGQTARFTAQCTQCGLCAQACYAQALRMAGFTLTPDELMQRILPDQALWTRSGGGVTFSGGEPLLQPDFLAASLHMLHAQHVHTALETALLAPWDALEAVMPCTDLFLTDVKCVDEETHIQATGQSNRVILEHLKRLDERGANICVRVPVVPTFNDRADHFLALSAFLHTLRRLPPVDLIPFRKLCAGKYRAMNRAFPGDAFTEPTAAQINEWACLMRANGVDARVMN